ncbi:Coiled-coil domain-containing protein [Wickerhamomyces ciferrii]|uniref:Coiled-coil domain-containing protein n=1 Tax=Wickerhamomyces ciferrii (strain ATCC 14091 / BCRC 22168 / CBS 111 / JCM 3599 / NBRC 0793 / NRRL Y-1031 F-60-10) TaxID=1206466 RepID=K0KI55_WICCF|nr:Coiled-coil domain-containing protein [Wickerhamomyces ciferrii]CCH44890.1 Coiled-coil domain-containing protein [Wickerhamomyces ciferrii]
MVYYFKSIGSDHSFESSPRFIYMGADKLENEDLIKYGHEEDVWFHVDNLSSAHVYLRLEQGEKWDEIPEPLLWDCAQLTKANSIEGNKRDNITVIYTPWSNLKRTKGMADGEVSFKNHKKVKKIHIQVRENSIINRLKKTREEIKGRNHLIEAKNNRDKEYTQKLLNLKKQQKLKDEEEKKKIADEKKRKETLYDDLFDDEEINKSSNQKRMYDPEDDFW